MNDAWLSLPAMQTLLDQLVQSTIERYRIDRPRAHQMLKESLATSTSLRALVEEVRSVKQIQRTRIYKKAAADAKRQVYYALRRYHDADADMQGLIQKLSDAPLDSSQSNRLLEQICNTHASTRERQPHADEFYQQILQYLEQASSLLDIGCGVHPLQFPFKTAPPSLSTYLALDSDAASIRAIESLAKHQQRNVELVALQHDLSAGWEIVLEKHRGARFDVALMFKLVAVIHRHDRQLLSTLAAAPATTWLVSGSKQSMAKRRDISRRERAILRHFVRDAGRNVTAEFEVGEEFVFVAE